MASPRIKSLRLKKHHSLPKDVLIKIFQHFTDTSQLCLVSEVCKQWFQASLSPSLWKRVSISDKVTRSKEQNISSTRYKLLDGDGVIKPSSPLIKGYRRKKRLRTLSGASLAIDLVTRRAKNSLLSLDLSHCFPNHQNPTLRMNNEDLEKLAKCCPSLQELRVSPSKSLTGEGFVRFTSKMSNLKVLHMTGCEYLKAIHFREIVKHCPQLEDISLRKCTIFSSNCLEQSLLEVRDTLRFLDISFTPIRRMNLRRLMFLFPKLEEIHADCCPNLVMVGNPAQLDSTQESLFPSLKILSIDEAYHIPPNLLIPIVRTSFKMESLSLNHMHLRAGGDSILLDGQVPPLKHLSLAGRSLKADYWQLIFDNLRRSLIQCDISSNSAITGELNIAEGDYFEALEELNLSATSVTEESIREIVKISPLLTLLELNKCRSIRNRDFRRDALLLCGRRRGSSEYK